MKKILVTGGAGFIGSNLINHLLIDSNNIITSIDNFDNYYDKKIKIKNIENHFNYSNFSFKELDVRNIVLLKKELTEKFDVIIHLAAKAGVRPSIEKPIDYYNVNILGTQNIVDLAVLLKVRRIIFASSSSVYGINKNIPWSESDFDLKPISPYATSKIAAENILKTYSELSNLEVVSLRLFTVYGPSQRPDLAIHKFTKLISDNKTIELYGDGSTSRDYTYVNDVVSAFEKSISLKLENKYEVFNIGNNKTIKLLDLVKTIEKTIEKTAKINFKEEQQGDVPLTFSNISKAENKLNYNPKTTIDIGITEFIDWYKKENKC